MVLILTFRSRRAGAMVWILYGVPYDLAAAVVLIAVAFVFYRMRSEPVARKLPCVKSTTKRFVATHSFTRGLDI